MSIECVRYLCTYHRHLIYFCSGYQYYNQNELLNINHIKFYHNVYLEFGLKIFWDVNLYIRIVRSYINTKQDIDIDRVLECIIYFHKNFHGVISHNDIWLNYYIFDWIFKTDNIVCLKYLYENTEEFHNYIDSKRNSSGTMKYIMKKYMTSTECTLNTRCYQYLLELTTKSIS